MVVFKQLLVKMSMYGVFLSLNMPFISVNSADPDEMLPKVPLKQYSECDNCLTPFKTVRA